MSEPVNGWLSESQQRVWRSYLLAKTHIEEYLEEALRDFGLSLAEYELLVRLSESPDHTIRMGELAASVGHSRSRLTHTVKRMEQAGFVKRTSCASDGRGVQATMTQTGFDLLKKAAPAHVDSVRRVFVDAMSPEDYVALGRAMSAVLAVAD
ncbi:MULTISPECIES: MarR family winged helix-turn-helix transcriptional regulator [unclassified Tessaracoccus]|uniref:MarR family winged helix-turn-helix transcriptional regulator n=1 Tax=unclassified Tessaracoccus TaxID=2635419 RepID=UPI001601F67C|nr:MULTISPECIES: MarR family transcriptional regulator [unclassified Tessaracoccus]MBB1513652.1 MarR family transcriptional regulator [Tessaracoccus sp. MC1627]MBB1515534.1 MarR family transcriptional regulator [Tessaracoccus sp. MC1679]